MYKIEFCKGSNEGTAIYLNDESGGTRLFGPKCWGNINTVHAIPLTINDAERAIKELTIALEQLKQKV